MRHQYQSATRARAVASRYWVGCQKQVDVDNNVPSYVPSYTVIATGGLAPLVLGDSTVVDHLDPLLTLNGLRILYERNS